jgi:hypothetical protein
MTKWEYYIYDFDHGDLLLEVLGREGANGWELVWLETDEDSDAGNTAIFKRPSNTEEPER